MLIAGIDEAGYGPMLGPLLIGAAVFRFDGDILPDMWDLLEPAVCRPGVSDGRLKIGDSKQVYKRKGLTDLAAGVMSFADTAGYQHQGSVEEFLARFGFGPGLEARRALDWYEGRMPELDIAVNSMEMQTVMEERGLRFLGYVLRPVFAPEFNTILDQWNKSELLFELARTLATEILASHSQPDEDIYFLCDKQGGRNFYGPQLIGAFPDHGFMIEAEAREESSYVLVKGGRRMGFRFVMKGDDKHLPIALTSMACKLIRELFMQQFNAWWVERQPQLKPTAGYYTDALRFLEDTENLRENLQVAPHTLIRKK